MRLVFLSLILLCLTPLILNSTLCTIDNSNSEQISSFDDCKSYSTSSENKICCYVKGVDAKSNNISACTELTGTEKGAAEDLFNLEDHYIQRKYFFEADCNLGKKINLCDPDDDRSDTPLSTNFCKSHISVDVSGVDEDMQCCYLTGKNVQKKQVYSCIGIDEYFYDKKERINQIETGKFERLGALTDIKIECSNSYLSFLSRFLFLLVALNSLLL